MDTLTRMPNGCHDHALCPPANSRPLRLGANISREISLIESLPNQSLDHRLPADM
jgi:hypothetical protein